MRFLLDTDTCIYAMKNKGDVFVNGHPN